MTATLHARLVDAWIAWDARPGSDAAVRLEDACQELPAPTVFRRAVAERRRAGMTARDAIAATLPDHLPEPDTAPPEMTP